MAEAKQPNGRNKATQWPKQNNTMAETKQHNGRFCMFNGLKRELVVRFVDIGEVHFKHILFINKLNGLDSRQ
jgi:hypothetical protein